MEEYFEHGIERGVEPAIIAAEVIDAIRGERFWILTHPEARHAPVERMQAALSASSIRPDRSMRVPAAP